ncbi:unnamed protein product [Rhizophagus irregularis]|nr:unnamed protein product [Rhizophagus irregularis]
MAAGYTILEDDSDATQEFNITVFYPLDEENPCYVPKLEKGQNLSVANLKFAIGSVHNQIDTQLILTSATILPIKPEKVAFSMAINKSQGQTLDRVGIYLPQVICCSIKSSFISTCQSSCSYYKDLLQNPNNQNPATTQI